MANRLLMRSLFLTLSHLFLWFHSYFCAHCAITKDCDDDDDDDEGEEDSLMCRSTFEMHFVLGFVSNSMLLGTFVNAHVLISDDCYFHR